MISTIKTQIVLASASETRRGILESYNIRAKYVEHTVDEDKEIIEYKKTKKNLARYLAQKKAESIKQRFKKSLIIGSDQIILCKGNLINKPNTKEEAVKNLLLLQGNCHMLVSAICVLTPEGKYKTIEEKAKVYMRKIQLSDIETYVKNNKSIVYSTSGSYKIENDKLKCIKKIKGDRETILGFPVKKILPLLKKYNR
tara:strand:- start:449 stop:1042 length:594 start_codon:yes stop_codon:yes gene_type:complete